MKIHRLLILILVIFICSNSYSQKTRFFIMTRFVGAGDLRRVQGAASYFVTYFDNKLKKVYPCTTVLTENDIGVLLGHERMRNLLGSETPGLMKSISDALGCEYLISIEIGILPGEKFVINASLIPYKDKFPSLHASAYSNLTASSGDQNLKNCEEVAHKIIDGLKEVEICPFKGTVKINVVSDLQKDTVAVYPVFCNNMDGVYRIKTKTDNHAENNWELQKIAKYRTTGISDFTLYEEKSIEEQDDCYACSQQRKGARIFFEETKKYGEIKGLSQESQEKGKPIADARVDIRFQKDGTYTIYVDATSTQGDITTIHTKHAEGTCGSINDPAEKFTKKGDVPLHYIFGPYNGTSADKILKEKQDKIEEINPVSGEKTIYNISFDLERE